MQETNALLLVGAYVVFATAIGIAMLSPLWYPFGRLVLWAFRKDKWKLTPVSAWLYGIGALTPLAGIVLNVKVFKVESGMVLIPFLVLGWVMLAVAHFNDPRFRRA